MGKRLILLLCLLVSVFVFGQTKSNDYRKKQFTLKKDTVYLDTVPINPQSFKILNHKGIIINPNNYKVDFENGILVISNKKYKSITIEYFVFPEFLTRVYSPIDKKYIVSNNFNKRLLYSTSTNKKKSDLNLLQGLKTSGFISRGVTSGNNQNLVTNSAMDLRLEGKLSNKVSIRANIFDTNIPLQSNGYSQNITDFDRIFIELFSEDWKVTAGDLSLQNNESYFLPLTKQVAGLEVDAKISPNLSAKASGALVRGVFTVYNFVGIEGNQGPYKLYGNNDEPNIVIVGGSEKVFVNGVLLKRGKNKDYTIDYNIGELVFNTTYPITNDMRIRVEFQYSDRNYTRFVTYDKISYKKNDLTISAHFYNENDSKNSPIQQQLTTEQKRILQNAGNNTNLMVAPSAFQDSYATHKILYKKINLNNTVVYEYSTNPQDTLYSVSFTNIGSSKGSYKIDQTLANGTTFVYVGKNLGDYEPIIKLIAPTKLQLGVINTSYKPSEKTFIESEIALSNNDQNLFSSLGNGDNKGMASKLSWKQTLLDKNWKLKSDVHYLFTHKNFATTQRFLPVEFLRNWNLVNPTGNMHNLSSGLITESNLGKIGYNFDYLSYSESFKGSKHSIYSQLNFNKTKLDFNGSFLKNKSTLENNSFTRFYGTLEKSFGDKTWLGVQTQFEDNSRKDKITNNYILTSHKYLDYGSYLGIGDTTNVFVKIGYKYRKNDSIRNNNFTKINSRKTFYLQSTLVKNQNSTLDIYANYRITKNTFTEDLKALNTRVFYRQKLWKNFLQFTSLYETSLGNIAQQEFVYIEVEPGQGYYTWIDYNQNGTQEYDEFEIAEFQDQANYLRVPLPNLTFLPTQKVKWNQNLNIDFSKIKKESFKWLTHFYNQLQFNISNEQRRNGSVVFFNPFLKDDQNQLGLLYNFRNTFYFNRNKKKYSTSYTFGKTSNKNLYNIGLQEMDIMQHQLNFTHQLGKFWIADVKGGYSENELQTENFINRNYLIKTIETQPKIIYELNKDNKFTAFYHYKNKENTLGLLETLQQQKIGVEYAYLGKSKNKVMASTHLFFNDFEGNSNSPVGYQMLEGLQDGTNFTWNVLWQNKISSVLHLNLNYFGRKSENSKTIHTGSVQLKAIF